MKQAIPMNHLDDRRLKRIGRRREACCEVSPCFTPIWDMFEDEGKSEKTEGYCQKTWLIRVVKLSD